MFQSKEEYNECLQLDSISMGVNSNSFFSKIFSHVTNPRWRFIKKMRRTNYFFSKRQNLFYRLLFYISLYDYKKTGLKLGFSIPFNVIGEGLSLPHFGTIVISKISKIGKNARIHICVNIG